MARVEAQRRAHYLAELDMIRKARLTLARGKREDFEAAARRARHPEQADTTDAAGPRAFEADEGNWWVVSRYVLPDAVLEWSVPVTAARTSVTVQLTRERARRALLLIALGSDSGLGA